MVYSVIRYKVTCSVMACGVDKRIQLSSITLLAGFQLSFEGVGKENKIQDEEV